MGISRLVDLGSGSDGEASCCVFHIHIPFAQRTSLLVGTWGSGSISAQIHQFIIARSREGERVSQDLIHTVVSADYTMFTLGTFSSRSRARLVGSNLTLFLQSRFGIPSRQIIMGHGDFWDIWETWGILYFSKLSVTRISRISQAFQRSFASHYLEQHFPCGAVHTTLYSRFIS